MAFLSSRPISSRCATGLALAAALVVAPIAQSAAQTGTANPAESPADRAAPEAQNQPGAERAKSGESAPATAGESPQERDRRLVLLRLLVMGGGNYRPFGFFR